MEKGEKQFPSTYDAENKQESETIGQKLIILQWNGQWIVLKMNQMEITRQIK